MNGSWYVSVRSFSVTLGKAELRLAAQQVCMRCENLSRRLILLAQFTKRIGQPVDIARSGVHIR